MLFPLDISNLLLLWTSFQLYCHALLARGQSSGGSNCVLRPYTGGCGRTDVALDSYTIFHYKIAAVKISQVPWQAHVKITTSSPFLTYVCGAAILDRRHVITTASCITSDLKNFAEKVNPRQLRVIVGTRFVTSDAAPECGKAIIGVAQVVLHPQWRYANDNNNNYNTFDFYSYNYGARRENRNFNVALLKLNYDIQFNQFVRPICLARSITPVAQPGSLTATVGWGSSYMLLFRHYSYMEKVENASLCYFNSPGSSKQEEKICVKHSNRQFRCVEDYGGPMMTLVNGIWRLVGIFDRSIQSCFDDGVFTRVSHFRDWIIGEGVENLSDDFLQYSVRAHLETGSLPDLNIFDLKTIFCIVVNNGGIEGVDEGTTLNFGRRPGVGAEAWGRSASFGGWNCRYVDNEQVPANNLVCGNGIVISKRNFNEALLRRRWIGEKPQRKPIMLYELGKELASQGLNPVGVLGCLARPFATESGCVRLSFSPPSYICNNKYIADQRIYDEIIAPSL